MEERGGNHRTTGTPSTQWTTHRLVRELQGSGYDVTRTSRTVPVTTQGSLSRLRGPSCTETRDPFSFLDSPVRLLSSDRSRLVASLENFTGDRPRRGHPGVVLRRISFVEGRGHNTPWDKKESRTSFETRSVWGKFGGLSLNRPGTDL